MTTIDHPSLCLGCGLLPPGHAPGCPVVEARRADIPDPGATSRSRITCLECGATYPHPGHASGCPARKES